MFQCQAYDSKRCQSCQLIEMSYEQGLSSKIAPVRELFKDAQFNDTIKSPLLSEYRNKGKFIVGGDLTHPIIGIPAPYNHFLVSALTDCPLHTIGINKVALDILDNLEEFKLTPYNLETKKGEFKYLIISEGHGTGEISIRFGMRSSESQPRVRKLFLKLKKDNPLLKVCCFEVQPKHAAIFSGTETFLSDDIYIQHNFESMELSSSSSNFFQVNSLVAQKLYDRVFDRMKDEDIKVSVDLFCGVGGFAQQLSRFSERVYGIEINSVATSCANFSTLKNQISNISFICDDATNFRNHISEEIDLIVVNPPRRGLGSELCSILKDMAPKFIIYSSCNPKTLARDLEHIGENYQLESITPVDMFPLTNHLEVLAVLKLASV